MEAVDEMKISHNDEPCGTLLHNFLIINLGPTDHFIRTSQLKHVGDQIIIKFKILCIKIVISVFILQVNVMSDPITHTNE